MNIKKGSVYMNNSNVQSFINYLKIPENGVKPYSILTVILITLALGVIDTVGCVVLIIAAFVFVKKGHKGLGLLLALTNCIIPDALPLVDEAAGIIAVAVPLYTSWKKTKNVAGTVVNTIESHQEYQNNKENYSNMDGLNVAKDLANEFVNTVPEQSQIPSNDYIEQIKKLNDLKKSGILSDEEFQRKKEEILEKI